LDRTVAAAYGWIDYTPELPDGEILRRLLALNKADQGRNASMKMKNRRSLSHFILLFLL
jgi:hypothetical protein